MQCSVCTRTFAVELSVCPSCGTTRTQYDRAEAPRRQTVSREKPVEVTAEQEVLPVLNEKDAADESAPIQTLSLPRPHTSGSTLIEFPGKRAKDNVDWRNEVRAKFQAVQERRVRGTNGEEAQTAPATVAVAERASVINLLPKAEGAPKSLRDKALARIERARQNYETTVETLAAQELLAEPVAHLNLVVKPTAPEPELNDIADESTDAFDLFDNSEHKAFVETPTVAEPTPPVASKTPRKIAAVDDFQHSADSAAAVHQPVQSSSLNTAKNTAEQSSLEREAIIAQRIAAQRTPTQISVSENVILERSRPEAVVARKQLDPQTPGDDYAPLVFRLLSGALDLVICAVVAGVLLALFKVLAQPLTAVNLAVIIGVFATIKIAYLTASLMFAGATVSMSLFGLETVAVESGLVPNFRQALVNSIVYLCGLAFGGLGMLTVFLNSEKRAVHDLLAGTVVVRQE